jgi:hypothetical protein
MPLYGIVGVAVAVFVALTTWAAILRQMVVWYMGISIKIVVRDLEKAPQAS